MDESKKKILFWTILAGAGWGFTLAHKHKKRTADYFTGVIGGSLAGALAGTLINRFRKTSDSEIKDTEKLSNTDKFSLIKIERSN